MLRLRIDYYSSLTGRAEDKKPVYIYANYITFSLKGSRVFIGSSNSFINTEDIIEISLVEL